MPSYSFTDYRSQGQTIENVIIDIGRVPSGSLNAFNAYVALSRSRGRDSIRLLRDFDDKLFMTHPSSELAAEDDRLEWLDLSTIQMYEGGYYDSWNIWEIHAKSRPVFGMWVDTMTAWIFDKYMWRCVQFLLKKISELDTKTASEDGFWHASSDMRMTIHMSAKAHFNDILYLAITFFFVYIRGGG